MIATADASVLSWLAPLADSVAAGTRVVLAAPTDPEDENGRGNGRAGDEVSLYLLALADHPPLRGPERAPRQFMLRYLVSTQSPRTNVAHDLLGEILLAAMAHETYLVDLTPQPPELWLALGAAPRPSFILCVPVRRAWPERPVPLVEGIVVSGAPVGTLFGRLLGPKDIPLARARVELPALRRSATTDADGRFSLNGVPHDAEPKTLVVSARGQVHSVILTGLGSSDEPQLIRIDLLAPSP